MDRGLPHAPDDLGSLIAVIDAWAFEAVWGTATRWLGMINAVVPWLIAGFVLPMFDSMNACVKEGRMRAFSLFGSKYGAMMIMGFLVGHLIIVGWIYRVPGS